MHGLESETAVGLEEADSPIKVWCTIILLFSPCGVLEGLYTVLLEVHEQAIMVKQNRP